MLMPKVSVITVVRNLLLENREKVFLQCVASVRAQTYPQIEHIIIDGASQDGTLEFLESLGLDYYSEPDIGIYDAMNKGIDKAQGRYISFLNSDDYWHDKHGVATSVSLLEKNAADFSCGTAVYLGEQDVVLGIVKPTLGSFYSRIPFCIQTALFSKEKMLEVGYFDLQYTSASDYDYVLRFLLSAAKGVVVPTPFTTYRWTGYSKIHSEISDKEAFAILQNTFVTKCGLSENACFYLWNLRIQKDFILCLKEYVSISVFQAIEELLSASTLHGDTYIIHRINCIESLDVHEIQEVNAQADYRKTDRMLPSFLQTISDFFYRFARFLYKK